MSRLTRLTAVRKWEFSVWNRTAMTMMPPTIGRMPLSPPRTRTTHARTYSPRVSATTSGAAISAASAAGSTSAGVSSTAIGCSCAEPVRAAGRHQLDDELAVELRGRTHRRHPPQIEDGDAIGHLEDVVHV